MSSSWLRDFLNSESSPDRKKVTNKAVPEITKKKKQVKGNNKTRDRKLYFAIFARELRSAFGGKFDNTGRQFLFLGLMAYPEVKEFNDVRDFFHAAQTKRLRVYARYGRIRWDKIPKTPDKRTCYRRINKVYNRILNIRFNAARVALFTLSNSPRVSLSERATARKGIHRLKSMLDRLRQDEREHTIENIMHRSWASSIPIVHLLIPIFMLHDYSLDVTHSINDPQEFIDTIKKTREISIVDIISRGINLRMKYNFEGIEGLLLTSQWVSDAIKFLRFSICSCLLLSQT